MAVKGAYAHHFTTYESMWTFEIPQPHLEPFVLQNLFNSHHLLAVNEPSLVHHTKRPISNHLKFYTKEETFRHWSEEMLDISVTSPKEPGSNMLFIRPPKTSQFIFNVKGRLD